MKCLLATEEASCPAKRISNTSFTKFFFLFWWVIFYWIRIHPDHDPKHCSQHFKTRHFFTFFSFLWDFQLIFDNLDPHIPNADLDPDPTE
jgi:hypothetical protein